MCEYFLKQLNDVRVKLISTGNQRLVQADKLPQKSAKIIASTSHLDDEMNT
jgi:hypothetical protein